MRSGYTPGHQEKREMVRGKEVGGGKGAVN